MALSLVLVSSLVCGKKKFSMENARLYNCFVEMFLVDEKIVIC